MSRKFTPPTQNLSVLAVGLSGATNLPARFDDNGAERYEIVLPPVTLDAVRERGDDVFQAFYERNADDHEARDGQGIELFIQRLKEDEDLFEELVDEFRETDSYEEWRDGFEPMMNFYWPVTLAYGVTAEKAAGLMDEFASVCTLVKMEESDDDEYGIALSGGGMNLSDKLAVAYLCCGSIPPARLLRSLNGVIDRSYLDVVGEALAMAYKEAADWLRREATILDTEAAAVFARTKESEPA